MIRNQQTTNQKLLMTKEKLNLGIQTKKKKIYRTYLINLILSEKLNILQFLQLEFYTF